VKIREFSKKNLKVGNLHSRTIIGATIVADVAPAEKERKKKTDFR